MIAVKGTTALLQGVRQSACGGCAGESSCSTLGAWSTRTLRLRTTNTLGAVPGDLVEVELPDRTLLIAALLLYGLPLTALFLGGGLAVWTAGALDLPANPAFLLGAGAGVAAAWRAARAIHPTGAIRMVARCGPPSGGKGHESPPLH